MFWKRKKKSLDFSNTSANPEVENKVRRIISGLTEIKPWCINREMRLRANLDLSSLDVVEMVMELEKSFNISLSDDEILYCTKVGDIIDVVSSKIQK